MASLARHPILPTLEFCGLSLKQFGGDGARGDEAGAANLDLRGADDSGPPLPPPLHRLAPPPSPSPAPSMAVMCPQTLRVSVMSPVGGSHESQVS